MPIVSKQLDHARVQADGSVRVKEAHVDHKGQTWSFSYPVASEAEATTIKKGRDLKAQFEDVEFNELHACVQDRNTIASFAFVDLTEEQGEDRIVKWFAENLGGKAITVAWWIEGLTPPVWTAIATRIGYDAGQSSEIQDRSIDLHTAEDSFDDTVKI